MKAGNEPATTSTRRAGSPSSQGAERPPSAWEGGLRNAGMVAGLAVLVLLHLLPPPAPITEVGMGRVGLLAFAIFWWLFAPVPLAVTTLAALAFGVATGALTLDQAFASNTNWLVWFLIGAFGLSAALEVNGFNRRFALWFVNHPWLKGRPFALLFMFLTSAALMSGLMSNTVVTVVWLSLATTIYTALGLQRGDGFAEANSLGLAWLSNIGGIMTPIGTLGNVVTIGLIASATGHTVGFASWTFIGTFAGVLLIASTFLMMRYVVRPDVSALVREETVALLRAQQQELGPAKPAERWSVAWFGAAIFLWFVPDLMRMFIPPAAIPSLLRNLGLVVPALLIPVAMCLTPVTQPGRTRVLTWNEWSKGVDWGMALFIGGVLALGGAVGAADSGVSAYLQRHVEPVASGLPEYLFVFVLTLTVMMVTNVMSNLVTTAVFMPVGLTLSMSLGIGEPIPLGVLLGIAPSLSYALPCGTTTNAIVAGTGWLRLGMMARYGVLLMFLHALILTACVYPFAKFILS